MLAAVDALTTLAADWITLATITGERAGLRHDSEWLWLDPDPEVATVHGVSELLTAFTGHTPIDLDGWARAVQTGVSMATHNEAETRRDRFHQARYASGMAPDGGMRDKTLADALALVGARPPRQLAASS